MIKRTASATTVALFGLTLIFGAAGTAVAGSGKSCDGKKPKERDDQAVVVVPALPQA